LDTFNKPTLNWTAPRGKLQLCSSYRIHHRCPEGDYYKWAVIDNLPLTLEEVYASEWEFDCPDHGVQWARPFQAEIKRVFTNNQNYLQDSVSNCWAQLRKGLTQQTM